MKPQEEHLKYDKFCELLGTDRMAPEAEKLYITADSEGELTKPIRVEIIPRYFPKIKEDVIAAANEFMKDPLAIRYMNFLRVSCFALKEEQIPFLAPEAGNLMRNFGPVFAALGHTEQMEAEMKRRGIDEITAERVRNVFERCLIGTKSTFGYYGMRENIFFWDRHFLVPDIFPIETLEFEVTTLPNEGTYFRNKKNKEWVILIDVSDKKSEYCGYTVKSGGDPDKYITLPKADYEKILAPGEDVISVHIPKGTKVDTQTCENTYAKALEFIYKTFPEKRFKAIYCRSWLMSPQLKEILSEGSNILSFQSFYQRFPVKSSGQEIFEFVHPKPFEKYEDLPENTTLERGVKRQYLENRLLYVYAGIHLLEEISSEIIVRRTR